jgi:hypothetical protein
VVAAGPVVEQSPAASSLPIVQPLPSATPSRPSITAPASPPDLPAVFTPASDLPDTDAVASGYSLTRGSVDGASLASTLAVAFGLPGDVSQTSDGWIVGQPGGAAPAVTVNDDPLLAWTFSDPTAAEAAAVGVSMEPDRAREVASALLSTIGVDVTSVDWQVDRYADLTEVIAWQKLADARTQLAWRVGFGRAGSVVSASGFSAGLVEIPGYPIVGAATAVRRAALPTWSTLGPQRLPVPVTDVEASPTPTVSVPQIGKTRRPALQVPMQDVLVEQAELGLAQFWQPDGNLLILPAYQLTGDDGNRWSLIAVTGDDVDFVDVPSGG